MLNFRYVLPVVFVGAVALTAHAQKKADNEDEYYKLVRFDTPLGEVLECGAIELMPDGKIALGTRRGEIWMVENAYAADPKEAKFTRFAHGLHEILGLAYKDGWLYVTHRPDVTRIKYSSGENKADTFEIFAQGWEISTCCKAASSTWLRARGR